MSSFEDILFFLFFLVLKLSEVDDDGVGDTERFLWTILEKSNFSLRVRSVKK